jgi:hypothetical protein
VVVAKLDRLFRSVADAANVIADFDKKGFYRRKFPTQCASQTNWRTAFCYTLLSQCAKSHLAHCLCPKKSSLFFAK